MDVLAWPEKGSLLEGCVSCSSVHACEETEVASGSCGSWAYVHVVSACACAWVSGSLLPRVAAG
jgi:hypothetical protein